MISSNETIRAATIDDVKTILRFIKQKAEFDISMKGFIGVIETSEQLLLDTLFNENPYAHAVLAESAGLFNTKYQHKNHRVEKHQLFCLDIFFN